MAENREYYTQNAENGTVQISEDVVASVAAAAILETEGVCGLSANLTTDIAEMAWFFEKLDAYTKAHEIDFVLSIGLDAADLPEFVKPYLI